MIQDGDEGILKNREIYQDIKTRQQILYIDI